MTTRATYYTHFKQITFRKFLFQLRKIVSSGTGTSQLKVLIALNVNGINNLISPSGDFKLGPNLLYILEAWRTLYFKAKVSAHECLRP